MHRPTLAILVAVAIAVGGMPYLAWAGDGDDERSAGASLVGPSLPGRIDRDDNDGDDDRRDRPKKPVTVDCAPSLLGVFQYCPVEPPTLGYISLP